MLGGDPRAHELRDAGRPAERGVGVGGQPVRVWVHRKALEHVQVLTLLDAEKRRRDRAVAAPDQLRVQVHRVRELDLPHVQVGLRRYDRVLKRQDQPVRLALGAAVARHAVQPRSVRDREHRLHLDAQAWRDRGNLGHRLGRALEAVEEGQVGRPLASALVHVEHQKHRHDRGAAVQRLGRRRKLEQLAVQDSAVVKVGPGAHAHVVQVQLAVRKARNRRAGCVQGHHQLKPRPVRLERGEPRRVRAH